MKRRLLIGGSVGVAILLLAMWWFWPTDNLTEEVLARIKPGMSLGQARELLGAPLDTTKYQSLIMYAVGKNSSRSISGIGLEPRSAWDARITVTHIPDDDAHRDPPMLLRLDRSLWVGKSKMVIVQFNPAEVITNVWIFPVTKEGGGAWSWLKQQYEAWNKPRPLPARPATAVYTPRPKKK